MPLKPSHNLLVRGSNPCGGTNQLARVLTFTSREFLLGASSNSRWREGGAGEVGPVPMSHPWRRFDFTDNSVLARERRDELSIPGK